MTAFERVALLLLLGIFKKMFSIPGVFMTAGDKKLVERTTVLLVSNYEIDTENRD